MGKGEMGNGQWEMGDGRWELGDGRWEMGDGRWEMGDGRWEIDTPLLACQSPNLPISIQTTGGQTLLNQLVQFSLGFVQGLLGGQLAVGDLADQGVDRV